jgi:excisionase family DNA binding protein
MRLTKAAYSLREVSDITSVCRTKLYEEINKGRLRIVKVGSRTLVLADDLERWLSELSAGRAA